MPELNIIGAKEKNRYYPYQSGFRVTRETFFQAGQDSFSRPPAQNPDLFQSLSNVEPVTQGNLQRRRGYTLFNATSPTVPFHESYAYRNENNLSVARRLVWTSSSTVVVTDEAGNITSSPLFVPALSAKAVRMVLSRSYGYFADGAVADCKKWDGTAVTGNLTNWGIQVAASAASTTGPLGTSTGANIASAYYPAWTGPTSIYAADGVYATSSLWASQSATLSATGFSFGITPVTAQITGIQVDVKCFKNQASGPYPDIELQLIKGGVLSGPLKPGYCPDSVNSFISFGGPTDTWGLSFIGTDVNASNFGVGIWCSPTMGLTNPVDFSIDYVQITIFVSGSTIGLTATTGTGVTLLSGRIYTVVFQNSIAGTTSGLTPFSASSGPVANKEIDLTGLPVSSDPQVDTKLLLATADSGDETTLYLVAQLPNATTTYTDTMPDSQLLFQSIYQQTDVNGNLHGVANNNPPPAGLNYPIKHKGRIFGTASASTLGAGPTLYYSKNLDDVTTSTGTITGKWEEAWPYTYSEDISERAETVTGLLSDGQTLYIATDICVRRFIGDSPDNFQTPEVIFNEAGVVNQETWQVVFTEGQPVGAMWLTPDYRVMSSDFNTYIDVGTPIQDVLNSINTAVVQTVGHACFVSKGPSEYYMLYVPTESSLVANVVCVYNLRTKKWCIWSPTDTVTTSLLNVSSVGIPQWLFATQAGPIYQWDETVQQDRTGNTPVSYTVPVTTEWLDFGDMGLTKAINKIIVTTGDPLLTVAVQGAITDRDLDTGGKLVIPPTQVLQEIFGDLFVPMVAQPGLYKWYQITFTSPASTIVDVLDAFDIDVMPSMRM